MTQLSNIVGADTASGSSDAGSNPEYALYIFPRESLTSTRVTVTLRLRYGYVTNLMKSTVQYGILCTEREVRLDTTFYA